MAGACLVLGLYAAASFVRLAHAATNVPCDTPELGYQCDTNITHSWGQYAPYFSVPSELNASLPDGCDITFVQMLSRHGARDPTAAKTASYNATVTRIRNSVTEFGAGYEFLKDYEYTLGADLLTDFGRQQMVNSGIKFYQRYRSLASRHVPFIRESGQDRVIESGQKWAEGFYNALLADGGSSSAYPFPAVVISEDAGSNNTLDHGLCTDFEKSTLGTLVQLQFGAKFGSSIATRLNKNLPGASITLLEALSIMELCPFDTIANPDAKLSDFCGLFTTAEWALFDYLQSLGKYYGYASGNPLGPTQGVGFANELIARLTGTAVVDHTSTNSTLDADPATFPLDRVLYADFSHDNDMTSAFAALGLYNATQTLPLTGRVEPEKLAGYSATWTVPFAGRMYVEKMTCGGQGSEELVRILVNDRVIPLQNCGADELGRCTLSKFVDSLTFARSGGHWDQCFA